MNPFLRYNDVYKKKTYVRHYFLGGKGYDSVFR